MCECNPKAVIISRPNREGIAIETCKNCGKTREIPASYEAIIAYCNKNRIMLKVHSTRYEDRLTDYASRHRYVSTNIERLGSNLAFD